MIATASGPPEPPMVCEQLRYDEHGREYRCGSSTESQWSRFCADCCCFTDLLERIDREEV